MFYFYVPPAAKRYVCSLSHRVADRRIDDGLTICRSAKPQTAGGELPMSVPF